MTIQWNKVTWYSKLLAAIVLLGLLPAWTFYIGVRYQQAVDAFQVGTAVAHR